MDALEGFSAEQVDKARDAITDGAVVPTSRRGEFLVVSTDGVERYRTTEHSCTCRAGRYGRRCYHRAAVLLAATLTTTSIGG